MRHHHGGLSVLLTLGITLACGHEEAAPTIAPEHAVDSPLTTAAGGPPYRFDETAYVGATCGSNYAGPIDNCANEYNPPAPSILRDLEWPQPTSPTVATAETNYTYGSNGDGLLWGRLPTVPPPGKTEPLPFRRFTNDGRLMLSVEWPRAMSFVPYRPENVQHDWKTGSTSTLPHRLHYRLHPVVWMNPSDTMRSLAELDKPEFNALHSTICEASSPATGSKRERNPRACTAQDNRRSFEGDCYDLTIITNTAIGTSAWEMRSVDITVFVKNAKTPATGEITPGVDNHGTLVYPRNPTGEVKSQGQWILPDWTLSGFNPWGSASMQTVASVCASTGRPGWCEFLSRQKRRTHYCADRDGDTLQDPPTGRKCLPPSFMFEPVTTGDGHLLVLNMGGLFYSYSPNACDIDGFENYYPISHMPQDPDLVARYEIARSMNRDGFPRPFRASDGSDVSFGRLDGGAYPWIDRAGKNLFFSVGNLSRDGYWARESVISGQSRTATSAPDDVSRDEHNPDRGPGNRVAVIGAWTQGKLVVLDNTVTFSDFGQIDGSAPPARYKLRLYAEDDVWVRPKGAQALNSFENVLNMHDALNPTMPFDVVWMLSADTHHNAEVVFDEYHDNRAFVVAHMNAPTDWATGWPRDGFTPMNPSAQVRFGDVADFRFRENPRLQNAATTATWSDPNAVVGPATLRLRGGARVEPVAMGGVLGKGVYLDGDNDFIDMGYRINERARRESRWYFGIWLDPRETTDKPVGTSRTIFYFPDNSSVALRQRKTGGVKWFELLLRDAATGRVERVALPSESVRNGTFFHLGLKLWTTTERDMGRDIARRHVQVYVNGNKLGAPAVFVAPGRFGFQPMANVGLGEWTWMTVGDPGPAFVPRESRHTFKGWIDELRVYGLKPGDEAESYVDEFICNTALGTLVDPKGPKSPAHLQELATIFQTKLVCEQMALHSYDEPLDVPPQHGTDRVCVNRVHRAPHDTEGWRCARGRQLGIGALPLSAGAPRPDFRHVGFCTTCHVANHPLRRFDAFGTVVPGGLDLSALAGGTGPRYLDARRQPMNVPATLSGVMPAWALDPNWLVVPPYLGNEPDVYTLDHAFDGTPAPRVMPNP